MNKKYKDFIAIIILLFGGYFLGNSVVKCNQNKTVQKSTEQCNSKEVKDINNQEEKNRIFKLNTIINSSDRNFKIMEREMVKYVIDGDTIILNNGKKVRYISINTPERGECWYRQAKKKNQELIEGRQIFLEKDISNYDKYQRILRYVYVPILKKGVFKDSNNSKMYFVNMELVKAGLARVREYKPDLKYLKELKEVEKYAKQNKIGLWGGCEE